MKMLRYQDIVITALYKIKHQKRVICTKVFELRLWVRGKGKNFFLNKSAKQTYSKVDFLHC